MLIKHANLQPVGDEVYHGAHDKPSIDTWILDNLPEDKEFDITVTIGDSRHSCGVYYRQPCELYDDAYGSWFLFGGNLMSYALIRAGSFCDAYDIYLSEFVPNDNETLEQEIEEWRRTILPTNQDSEPYEIPSEILDYYAWDSVGNAYHETTICDIVALNLNNYDIQIEITERVEQ